MAKRARGSSSRPGQRAPLQRKSGSARPSATPASTPPADATSANGGSSSATPSSAPATLTPAEEARAASLEASIVAEEKAAESAARTTRERDRRRSEAPTARAGSLAARAEDEYAYVTRDLRRIAIIGGSMIALLLGLWIVVAVTGVGPF
jgi:hypothetical protein